MFRRFSISALALIVLLGATIAAAATLPPGGSFADDDGSVHEANIEAIAAEGITQGCNPPANDMFCPDKSVTRAQMATFLVRALALSPAAGSFTDTAGSVHEANIGALAAAGITVGCNPPANDMFCPDKSVTRAQMATFLTRALSLPAAPGSFVDTAGTVHEANIAALAAAGITVGCNPPTNDMFCPDKAVTRAQMATFLTRALGLTPIVPPPPTSSTSTTATSTTTSTTLPPGVGCGHVEIAELNWDAPGNDVTNPNGEWVRLRNAGPNDTDMSGCILEDWGPSHTYTFAGFTLAVDAEVQLFSGCGTDTADELYWCTGAVWNNNGDTATLWGPGYSTIVDTFSY